jgi:hypothetical protein
LQLKGSNVQLSSHGDLTLFLLHASLLKEAEDEYKQTSGGSAGLDRALAVAYTVTSLKSLRYRSCFLKYGRLFERWWDGQNFA